VDEHRPVKRPGWPEEQPPGRLHQEPDWLEWALIIAIVVAAVILGIILIGPQIANPPPCNCPNF
jgi:hypothetical protein